MFANAPYSFLKNRPSVFCLKSSAKGRNQKTSDVDGVDA